MVVGLIVVVEVLNYCDLERKISNCSVVFSYSQGMLIRPSVVQAKVSYI